jgi:hypothetical protein
MYLFNELHKWDYSTRKSRNCTNLQKGVIRSSMVTKKKPFISSRILFILSIYRCEYEYILNILPTYNFISILYLHSLVLLNTCYSKQLHLLYYMYLQCFVCRM